MRRFCRNLCCIFQGKRWEFVRQANEGGSTSLIFIVVEFLGAQGEAKQNLLGCLLSSWPYWVNERPRAMSTHPKADSGWVFAVFLPFSPWSSCFPVSYRAKACVGVPFKWSPLLSCLILMVAPAVRNHTIIRVTLSCGRALCERIGHSSTPAEMAISWYTSKERCTTSGRMAIGAKDAGCRK